MNEIEFINYVHTPQEKYFMGIATIKLYGKIVLRYKAIMKKEGTGYFIAPATYRVADSRGEFEYLDAVSVDSKLENEQMMELIRSNINKSMQRVDSHASDQQMKQREQQQQHQQQQPDLNSCPF